MYIIFEPAVFQREYLCYNDSVNSPQGKGVTRLLKIENIKLPPGASTDGLTAEAARLLRVRAADILSLRILRRSVDAREDPALVYTVDRKSVV